MAAAVAWRRRFAAVAVVFALALAVTRVAGVLTEEELERMQEEDHKLQAKAVDAANRASLTPEQTAALVRALEHQLWASSQLQRQEQLQQQADRAGGRRAPPSDDEDEGETTSAVGDGDAAVVAAGSAADGPPNFFKAARRLIKRIKSGEKIFLGDPDLVRVGHRVTLMVGAAAAASSMNALMQSYRTMGQLSPLHAIMAALQVALTSVSAMTTLPDDVDENGRPVGGMYLRGSNFKKTVKSGFRHAQKLLQDGLGKLLLLMKDRGAEVEDADAVNEDEDVAVTDAAEAAVEAVEDAVAAVQETETEATSSTTNAEDDEEDEHDKQPFSEAANAADDDEPSS